MTLTPVPRSCNQIVRPGSRGINNADCNPGRLLVERAGSPRRRFPGKIDVWGDSQPVFHPEIKGLCRHLLRLIFRNRGDTIILPAGILFQEIPLTA